MTSFAVERIALHNETITASTAIASAIVPMDIVSPILFRIQVAFDTAGAFYAGVTRASVYTAYWFNGAANLTANCIYLFDMLVNQGDSVIFGYSVGAILLNMRVVEIVGAEQ